MAKHPQSPQTTSPPTSSLDSIAVLSLTREITDATGPKELHRLLTAAGLGDVLDRSWRVTLTDWARTSVPLYRTLYNTAVPSNASLGVWMLSSHNRLLDPGIYERGTWEALRSHCSGLVSSALRQRLVVEEQRRVFSSLGRPPGSEEELRSWAREAGIPGYLDLPVTTLGLDPDSDPSSAKWLESEGDSTAVVDALTAPPWTGSTLWRRGSEKVPVGVASAARQALLRRAAVRRLAIDLRRSRRTPVSPDPVALPQLAGLFARTREACQAQEALLGPLWDLRIVNATLRLSLDPPRADWVSEGPPHEGGGPGGAITLGLGAPLTATSGDRSLSLTAPSIALRDVLNELLLLLAERPTRPMVLRLESDLAQSPLDRFLADLGPALSPNAPRLGLELRSDVDGPWLALLDIDPAGQARPKTRALHELQLAGVTDPHEQRVLTALTGGIDPELQSAAAWKAVQHRRDRIADALLAARGLAHQYVKGSGRRPLVLRQAALSIFVDQDTHGTIALHLDGAPIDRMDLRDLAASDLAGPQLFIDWASGVVTVAPVTGALRTLARTLLRRGGDLGPIAGQELIARLPALQAVAPLELGEALRGSEVAAELRLIVRLELVADGITMGLFARALPGGELLHPGRGLPLVYGSIDGVRVHAERDLADEQARVVALQEGLGLGKPDDPELGWRWVLLDHLAAAHVVTTLAGRDDVVLEWQGKPATVRHAPGAERLRVRFASMGEWFGVTGDLSLPGGKMPLAELLLAAEQGRRFVPLGPGEWLRLGDELLNALTPLASAMRGSPDGASVSRLHAPLLAELPASGADFEAPPEWLAWVDRAAEAAALDPELPAGLQAALRPYQREGFVWLARLAHWASGAVLADDMGLGKTVQALALLLRRAAEGPALVVAPASVGFNWARECARFAPDLRVVEYQGTTREALLEQATPGALVICTWAVMARDAEALAGVTWATVVFDEAQAMKNRDTHRNKAARALPAGFRLALTGTPVENHAGELHALLGVVVPGLLGGGGQFRERFLNPIARDDDGAKGALARLVAPFVLRRLKRDVATELPDRSEIEVFVELSKPERGIYEQVRKAALAEMELASSLQEQQRRFRALGLLTRLRQAACHPRLIDPESAVPSSKLERAIELLEELREEGHKALVFSQFTSHLGLVRDALVGRGWRLLYLDGSTPTGRRATLVDSFQNGEADAFLISLKAGGTGLNLTAASYVIHLDPWWNPAVEDQATDRAHRIGQDRAVTVYRLIAKESVEESIVRLHGRKRELADALLAGAGSSRALSPEQLLTLFSSQGATDGMEGGTAAP